MTLDDVSLSGFDQDPLTALHMRHQALACTSCGVTLADAQDPGMPLVYVNQAFVDITGYSREEILGKNCRILQGELRDQEGVVEIRQALAEVRSCKVLLRNFKKDGTPFWNELTMSPIFDGEGEVSHFVGIQTDVTEREEARADLRRLSANLDASRRDAERFAELVAARLQDPLAEIEEVTRRILAKPEADAKALRSKLERLADQAKHLHASIAQKLTEAKGGHESTASSKDSTG